MEDKQQVPSFLIKLYEILESDQQSIVWNKEGTTFQIHDPNLLTEEILPQYFKHRNYQSFLRQLNMYGFKKIKNKSGKSEFQHSSFRKGVKSNLLKIKRRNQEDIKQSLENLTREFQQESYLNEHEKLRKQLKEITDKQKRLSEEVTRQTQENLRLRKETQDLSEKMNSVKACELKKLNKLILVIHRLPEDAKYGKMAQFKERIKCKLETIENENFVPLNLSRGDSQSIYEPNLTDVRSPFGYSPKIIQ